MEPQPQSRLLAILAALGALAVAVGVAGGLAVVGVFSPSSAPAQGTAAAASQAISVTVLPDAPARMESIDGRVVVQLPAGTVDRTMLLRYQALSPDQLPVMPTGFLATGTSFSLSLIDEGQSIATPQELAKPVTISLFLSEEEIALARRDRESMVIHHYLSGSSTWTAMPTEVDLLASTAQAQLDSFSLFALTVRQAPNPPVDIETEEIPAQAILVREAAPSSPPATPVPAPSPTPGANVTPIPTPTPVPVSTITPLPRFLLETGVRPAGSGTVDARPASRDGSYVLGSTVLVTASCPAAFMGWLGDLPEADIPASASMAVLMDRDRVLIAICTPPTPTPSPDPTSMPPPTPAPEATPTLTPVAVTDFILFVNGIPVPPLQQAIRVPGGVVMLHQPAQGNGTYAAGVFVDLQLVPDIEGAPVTWSGVDIQDGYQAGVRMSGQRFVVANIVVRGG